MGSYTGSRIFPKTAACRANGLSMAQACATQRAPPIKNRNPENVQALAAENSGALLRIAVAAAKGADWPRKIKLGIRSFCVDVREPL
jgi:hypothetical protein